MQPAEILQIIGGQVLLPILIILLVSPNMIWRHPLFLNFCICFVLYSIVFSLRWQSFYLFFLLTLILGKQHIYKASNGHPLGPKHLLCPSWTSSRSGTLVGASSQVSMYIAHNRLSELLPLPCLWSCNFGRVFAGQLSNWNEAKQLWLW